MKINVSKIKKISDSFIEIEMDDEIKGLEGNTEDIVFKKPVSFKGTLKNTDGLLKLEGHIKADYSTNCFRCLEKIENTVEMDISEFFSSTKNNNNEDVYFFEDEIIEIDDALRDNIILTLPMKMLCSDDCKGLCVSCGKNLNKEHCNCIDENEDTKMNVLKDLFNDKLS